MPRVAAREIVGDVRISPLLSHRARMSDLMHRPGTIVLVLESSTASASIALMRDAHVVQQRAVAMGPSRDDAMLPAIMEMLAAETLLPGAVSEVVCGAGPGSFTSLRIAAAIAKGLVHATGAPLYAVPSLLLAVAGRTPGRYLVHSDALRGEQYLLRVTIDDGGLAHADGPVERVPNSGVASGTEGRIVLSLVGSALSLPDATMVAPDAAALPSVAEWRARGAVDVASWEPAYGRLAEAQVKWEIAHQRPLPTH